jgi:hypothetical protein
MLSLAPRTGNDTELNKTLLMTGFQYQHITYSLTARFEQKHEL